MASRDRADHHSDGSTSDAPASSSSQAQPRNNPEPEPLNLEDLTQEIRELRSLLGATRREIQDLRYDNERLRGRVHDLEDEVYGLQPEQDGDRGSEPQRMSTPATVASDQPTERAEGRQPSTQERSPEGSEEQPLAAPRFFDAPHFFPIPRPPKGWKPDEVPIYTDCAKNWLVTAGSRSTRNHKIRYESQYEGERMRRQQR